MNSNVETKSFLFSVRVVKLARYLQEEKKEYILPKQLIRSGTSIGANVVESQQAQSRADFVSKLSIALKEGVKQITGFACCKPPFIFQNQNLLLLSRIVKSWNEC